MTQTDPFADLVITPSAEPLPAPLRGARQQGPNPFTDALRASREHETPYVFHVHPQYVTKAITLINAGARRANLGVRIVANVARDEANRPVKDEQGKVRYVPERTGEHRGKVRIAFQAGERRHTALKPYRINKQRDGRYAVKRSGESEVLFLGDKESAAKRRDELIAQGR